jgi:hypothetical protein
MNPPEKKKMMTRHVYKTGAAGCGGKAAPTSAKNAGQVSYSIATFFFIFASGCLLGLPLLFPSFDFTV